MRRMKPGLHNRIAPAHWPGQGQCAHAGSSRPRIIKTRWRPKAVRFLALPDAGSVWSGHEP